MKTNIKNLAVLITAMFMVVTNVIATSQVVLFEQPTFNRLYSIFPAGPTRNDAFAQTFILSSTGQLDLVQMPARVEGAPPLATISFYQLPSTSTPPSDQGAILLATYVATQINDLDGFSTIIDTSSNPLQLNANTPYAMVIEVPNVAGGVFDIKAFDPPGPSEAYPDGTLMILKNGQWGSVTGNDLAFRLVGRNVLDIAIDIKPGSDPNSINTKSNGKIPMAILSTENFDSVVQIDINSLTFGRAGDEQSLDFCSGSEDVNGDGLIDLVCHFSTNKTDFIIEDQIGFLKGKTNNGISVEGHDVVRIIK